VLPLQRPHLLRSGFRGGDRGQQATCEEEHLTEGAWGWGEGKGGGAV
jgi:hypothetical protein